MIQTNKKLKVVIDTNILLVAVSTKSKYHSVFQNIKDKIFDLYVTNDIISEYKEILLRNYNPIAVENLIELLLVLPNVHKTIPYFNWNLISVDPDDNKFVDCVVAGNVDYIVTNDRYFDVLKSVGFPKINVIKIDEFVKLFD